MKNYKHGLNELVKLGPIIQHRALERPWNSMKLHYRTFLRYVRTFLDDLHNRYYTAILSKETFWNYEFFRVIHSSQSKLKNHLIWEILLKVTFLIRYNRISSPKIYIIQTFEHFSILAILLLYHFSIILNILKKKQIKMMKICLLDALRNRKNIIRCV